MLVSSLALLVGMYAWGLIALWRRAGVGRGIRRWQAACFGAAWLVLVAALSSPMDEWSDTYLAAHMVQHELLMAVAAPLFAVSAAGIAMLWLVPESWRRDTFIALRRPALRRVWRALTAPMTVFLLHALALWVWHLPALYDAAVEHEDVHIVQHLCFFGSAVLFWWGLIHGRYGRAGYGAAVIYVFATAVHAGVLGALLTISPRVWYAPYLVTHPSGLTPLEDQQLAGLVMWVPAGILTAAGGLALFAAWLRESERRTRFKTVAVPRSS
jgi:cytochrome c oxidase assembly factor CtaG